MMFRRLVSAFGLLAVSQSAALAAFFYVAPGGSDSDPGSLAQPWATIQKAANVLAAGDTVYVRTGSYGPVTVNVSGSALGGFVTFCNYPGETPIIDGSGRTPPDGETGLFYLSNRSCIAITGFELRNYQTTNRSLTPAGIYLSGACQHVQIRRCNIHDIANTGGDILTPGNAFGIAVNGSAATPSNDILIDGNDVYNLKTGASESLVINGNVTGFQVTNNSVHDNNNIGIDFIGFEGTCPDSAQDQARDGICRANTVYNISSEGNPAYASGDFSADGIYCDGAARILVERNIVHDTDIGVEVASEHAGQVTSGITLRDNVFYLNRQAGLLLGGFAKTGTGGTDGCTISGNTFFGNDTLLSENGEAQLRFRTSHCDLRDNIFSGGAGNTLVTAIASAADNVGNSLDYNFYFSPFADTANWSWNGKTLAGLAAWKTGSGQDSHAVFADPKFVSIGTPLNFHVSPSSPVVDAGDPAFAPASDEREVDGGPRLTGARVDIGAEELPPPPPTAPPTILGNISTRLNVGSGDNVLIGGFIVTGSHEKKLIIRARGPSLAHQGVADALLDPTLSLVDAAGHIAAINNDWGDNLNRQEIADSQFAPADPRESALLVTLAPGAYTAIVSSMDGSTGVALVEVYDLDSAVDSKLANISTRGLVQSGDNVLIGGVIVVGTVPEKMIIRARGPSLTGVAAALPDPMLELRDANGGLIAANDDWQEADGANIAATNLAPALPSESAILAMLGPGNYTAIVRGKNGTAGVGIVEVYDLQ